MLDSSIFSVSAVASIVLATKNRKEELRSAIKSVFEQSVRTEVIVIDDASTDGTADMVLSEFPEVRLERSESSLGYIKQRNRAARLASSPVIFSLDDDAVFSSPDVVEQILSQFSSDRIGAVAIPYVDVDRDKTEYQTAPDESSTWITDRYIGTAHAVRRELFLKLGGYRESFIHQGEEGDFCIRMLNAGYVVRLGVSDPIHHFECPQRDLSRMDFYGRRNDILFAWHNVPMPFFVIHLLGTTLNGLASAFRAGRYGEMLKGIGRGYADCFDQWKDRQPVSAEVYALHRRLRKRGPRLLSEIQERLPELDTDAVQHS